MQCNYNLFCFINVWTNNYFHKAVIFNRWPTAASCVGSSIDYMKIIFVYYVVVDNSI